MNENLCTGYHRVTVRETRDVLPWKHLSCTNYGQTGRVPFREKRKEKGYVRDAQTPNEDENEKCVSVLCVYERMCVRSSTQ